MYVYLYDCVVLERTQQKSTKFGTGYLHALCSKYICIPYWSNIITNLCENHISKKNYTHKISVKQEKNTPLTDISVTFWKHSVTVNIQRHSKHTERDHNI